MADRKIGKASESQTPLRGLNSCRPKTVTTPPHPIRSQFRALASGIDENTTKALSSEPRNRIGETNFSSLRHPNRSMCDCRFFDDSLDAAKSRSRHAAFGAVNHTVVNPDKRGCGNIRDDSVVELFRDRQHGGCDSASQDKFDHSLHRVGSRVHT